MNSERGPSLGSLIASGAVVQLGQDAILANEGGNCHLASLPPVHQLRSRPYDISALRAEFGWEPRSFSDAIREYMGWLQAHQSAKMSRL